MPYGPLSRTNHTVFPGTAARSYYFMQSGYKGDGKEVLPYTMVRTVGTPGMYPSGATLYIDSPNSYSIYDFLGSGGIPSWSVPAANSAYSRFREKALGSESSVGAALGEWRQSLDMITNRASQLVVSIGALRRRNFAYFLYYWKLGKYRNRRDPDYSKARKAADLWLEYSFGWKPLLGDIKSACDQISEPPPADASHVGWASDTFSRVVPSWLTWQYYSHVTHWVGGRVKLTNPNLFLASQLGLVNPLSVAWELTPGSFIADWMFDISSFIGSMSDFIGTEVTGSWRSSLCDFRDASWVGNGAAATSSGVGFVRRSGLYRPMPNMEIRRNVGESMNRAANAVALVTQILTQPDRIG